MVLGKRSIHVSVTFKNHTAEFLLPLVSNFILRFQILLIIPAKITVVFHWIALYSLGTLFGIWPFSLNLIKILIHLHEESITKVWDDCPTVTGHLVLV